jgi:DNA-binding response OmpR family regulator
MMSRKILLIKGGGNQNNIIASLIEKVGYISLLAKSTLEAIRLIKTQEPCLVIMTSHLSLSNARNSLSRLQKISKVPIIMIGERDQAVTMLESGADAYIETPINEIELIARVNSILRRQRYSGPKKNKRQKLVTYY